MNHKEKLLEIYSQCNNDSLNINLPADVLINISIIGKYIESQKGVFTVLITLGIHKILNNNQDIRYHQTTLDNGFSGRTVDTKYITPTLKELKLPSMSESGWLTRSLEQPYPYTLTYEGKISNKKVKKSFLELVDFINNTPVLVNQIIYLLLKKSIKIREDNKVEIIKINNPDHVSIDKLMSVLMDYMKSQYSVSGGSKIPVIIFYSIYQILINELKRYDNCTLKELGFHTTCDKTSKSSGDIEIYKGSTLFESVEIKFDINIDSHIVNRVIEKIHRFNPSRYYVLSTSGVSSSDVIDINNKIFELGVEHGCQLIVNGLYTTLKYYMRLIDDTTLLINNISTNISTDKELKVEHKTKWKDLHNTLL
jgi:DNA (cytosine-5)-methyltransferase 1